MLMLVTTKSDREWEALPARVREWIENALRVGDPKPSPEAYYKLAEKIRVILNRHNNAELKKLRDPPSNTDLKDVPAQELGEEILHGFYNVAGQMLVEADKVESFFGNYTFDESISLSDVTQMLHSLRMCQSALPRIPEPQKSWGQTGRKIALEIELTMRAAGKAKGRLSAQQRESITAIAGSKVISWAFQISLTSTQFAEKMRPPHHPQSSTEDSFAQRYPEAMNIKLPDYGGVGKNRTFCP